MVFLTQWYCVGAKKWAMMMMVMKYSIVVI